MANWYVGSTKYTAVAQWAALHTYAAGAIVRQLSAPSAGNERCFQTAAGGVSAAAEPTWVLTQGSSSPTDGTITDWKEITGLAAKNGDGGGSNWAAPHARIANAYASGWAAAGDNIYVSNNHAATVAAGLTLTNPGTAAAPCPVISVDDTTALPPTTVLSGASESCTGNSGTLTFNGQGYFYGISFQNGSGSSFGLFQNTGANNTVQYFDTCKFNILATGATSAIRLPGNSGAKDSYAEFRNCTFLFSNSSQRIQPTYGKMDFINCSFATSQTVPGAIFSWANTGSAKITVRDCDLSHITGSLVDVSNGTFGEISFENCKLASGVGVTTGAFTSPGGATVKMHNCDDSTNNRNYRFYEANYAGNVQQETTVVRTGGASNGTTPISWNINSTANAKFGEPFSPSPIWIWNSATGSPLTATVEITSNNTLQNGDVWLEIEYLGDANSPLASFLNNRKASILASAANITSSSASWGGSTTTQQKLQVTFTPQKIGYVKARVYVAKASQQVYIDPLITLQ